MSWPKLVHIYVHVIKWYSSSLSPRITEYKQIPLMLALLAVYIRLPFVHLFFDNYFRERLHAHFLSPRLTGHCFSTKYKTFIQLYKITELECALLEITPISLSSSEANTLDYSSPLLAGIKHRVPVTLILLIHALFQLVE